MTLQPPLPKKYFAQRFALWIGLCSMFMIFAGWTSALLVRREQDDWLQFDLPIAFYISTAVILLSSITMVIANHHYKNDNYNHFRLFLAATFLLGIAFTILQYVGWGTMKSMGIPLGGEGSNPSGSFVYIITYGHIAHLIGGLFFLAIALVRSIYIFKNPSNSLIKNIDPTKGVRMDLLSTYWHFVGILWIYLFLFLLINK